MSKLFLVRHGESEWNRKGLIQGQYDSPLTANGVSQAHSVAVRLVQELSATNLTIFSSPLSRALDTAVIIARTLGIDPGDIQVDKRINDFHLGEISGTPGWDRVAEIHPELARFRLDDPLRFCPPGGECGADFRARLQDFLGDLPADGTHLIVSHGVANKFIRSIARDLHGADIIALGEGQDTIYCLDGGTETELNVTDDMTTPVNQQVPVNLGERSYDIVVGSGLLDHAADYLRGIIRDRRIALVSDAAVLDTYLARLAPQLDQVTSRWNTYRISGGESAKSFDGVEQVLNSMLEDGVDRESIVVAFGGGVVGDVGGFAAALLMRGIELIQIPTTLMSQVDSSVGGKNGINTRHGKNLVGSFLQPRIVLNDVTTLKTLPLDEFRSGYGEIIKYGLLRGEQEFSWLERNVNAIVDRHEATLIEVLRMGCETKAAIVSEDELDRGKRALVNLGHTFAHAFETHAGFGQFTHGNAVAVGLIAASHLSESAGFCNQGLAQRVKSHAAAAGLPTSLTELSDQVDWKSDGLFRSMLHDKKTVNGRIHFVLLKGVGDAFVTPDVEAEQVLVTLDAMGARRVQTDAGQQAG